MTTAAPAIFIGVMTSPSKSAANSIVKTTSKFVSIDAADKLEIKKVRFRTVGDMTCTAAMESEASDIDAIIEEVMTTRSAERGARLDDKRSEAAMEDRKKAGYF